MVFGHRKAKHVLRTLVAALLASITFVAAAFFITAPAQAHTECAPYAREISGINLYGAAGGWWNQAEGLYARGNAPVVGSVLAFRATHVMPSGHVAVVRSVLDARHVMLNHANWSHPGAIETSALAEDVSANGDWSQVRVWYAPVGGLGIRAVPAYGFIYRDGRQGAQTNAGFTSAQSPAQPAAQATIPQQAPQMAMTNTVHIPGF